MLIQASRKVYRNGLIFQVPTSIFSSYRYMGVHADGSGTSWDEASPDIDQPHGLDYRSHQDIRKGTRKRIGKEHREFADATVGGEHLPGGCGILGIVESTDDLTVGAGDASIDITDGMFQGRGLIYDQTRNVLWCYTGDGTVNDDPYLVALHPDRAWGGGDITWSGIHQFDASVCFSDGEVTGAWLFEGTVGFDNAVDFSKAIFEGTVAFNNEVDFSEVNINGAVDAFGSWAVKSNNTKYQADTDGFVCAWSNSAGGTCKGFTDAADPPTTQRAGNFGDAGAYNHGVTFPVKKGDWWKVTGASTIFWLPIGL